MPKTRLVNVLDAGLSTGDLEIAADLPEYATFEDELGDFGRRISDTGRLSFGAREGRHDDTIIAVGLALWWATRKPRGASERVRVREWR